MSTSPDEESASGAIRYSDGSLERGAKPAIKRVELSVPTAAAWVASQPGAAAPASSGGTGLVHEHGLVLAPVRGPAGLVVAVDVDPSHEPGPCTGCLKTAVVTWRPSRCTCRGVAALTDRSLIARAPSGHGQVAIGPGGDHPLVGGGQQPLPVERHVELPGIEGEVAGQPRRFRKRLGV
jgi:hypothetical protein